MSPHSYPLVHISKCTITYYVFLLKHGELWVWNLETNFSETLQMQCPNQWIKNAALQCSLSFPLSILVEDKGGPLWPCICLYLITVYKCLHNCSYFLLKRCLIQDKWHLVLCSEQHSVDFLKNVTLLLLGKTIIWFYWKAR